MPGGRQLREGIPAGGRQGGGVLLCYNTAQVGKWGTNTAEWGSVVVR